MGKEVAADDKIQLIQRVKIIFVVVEKDRLLADLRLQRRIIVRQLHGIKRIKLVVDHINALSA